MNDLELLKPEMRSKLEKGLSEWGESSKIDDGESCLLDIEKFLSEHTFVVSWSGGTSWGDIGVDFTIKNGVIIDESWGD